MRQLVLELDDWLHLKICVLELSLVGIRPVIRCQKCIDPISKLLLDATDVRNALLVQLLLLFAITGLVLGAFVVVVIVVEIVGSDLHQVFGWTLVF